MQVKQRSKSVWFNNTSGERVNLGKFSLTPQAKTLVISSSLGGLVWNRPVALVVEHNGRMERIPILDITRIAQIGILGVGFLFSILGLVKFMKRKDVQR